MNITWLRLKPVVKELREIRKELQRLANCWEEELAQQGIYVRPAQTDTSGPEPTVEYQDDEMDWINEQIDRVKEAERGLKEESDAEREPR